MVNAQCKVIIKEEEKEEDETEEQYRCNKKVFKKKNTRWKNKVRWELWVHVKGTCLSFQTIRTDDAGR